MSDAKLICLGLVMYASTHQNQHPSEVNEVIQALSDSQRDTYTKTNQFEIVAQGSWASITNPADAIVVRETEPHQVQGVWVKTYGFADGHSELKRAPDEGFEAWEKQHIPLTPN